jgi:hypothetical protein
VHEIERVNLVHHINELKIKMAKKVAIKFPNHNTTHATLIPNENKFIETN